MIYRYSTFVAGQLENLRTKRRTDLENRSCDDCEQHRCACTVFVEMSLERRLGSLRLDELLSIQVIS